MVDAVSHYSNITVLGDEATLSQGTFQLYGRLGSSKLRLEPPEIDSYVTSYREWERLTEDDIKIEPPPRKRSFTMKKHFQFVRRMAIEQIFVNMQRNLSLYMSSMVCLSPEAEQLETPLNMFGWAEEDFYARRGVKHTAWIEVFLRQLPKECVENKKLQVDVKEIMKYAGVIHDEFREQNTDIIAKLQSIYEFISIAEALRNNFNENVNEEENLGTSYHGRVFKKTEEAARREKINQLEYIIFESDVYDPIEVRYQLRYYRTAVEEFKEKMLVEQEAINKQIRDIIKRTRVENYCSECTVNALYAEIGKYKNRIEVMEVLYAKESDKYDNTINYKRFNMDKARTQRSYLEEQIIRFREEIAQIKLQEIREAEFLQAERERKMNEKLLAEAAKKQKKKKK